MTIFSRIIIIFSKLIRGFIKLFHLGAGLTWPGEIAIRLKPSLLKEYGNQRVSIVLVSGTNGKTTTVKMLDTILRTTGKSVKRNISGANLDNGIISGFIEDSDWFGSLQSDFFIFEVDEATLARVAHLLNPRVIVLLNLFRDQLDRYGEVDAIAENWMSTFSTLSRRTHFLLNGDDPHLVYIGKQLHSKVDYMGLEDSKYFRSDIQHATDSIYCPSCGTRLIFGGIYFSHLGKWTCGKCGLTHPDLMITSADYQSPIPGIYNIYNTLAAASTCKILGLQDNEIRKGLQAFIPAFGRFETLQYKQQQITILLSKNPAGFNESLRTALDNQSGGRLLILLNDRIPDGADVSWIWDVDFEMLKNYISDVYVSGDRCFDLALRIKYSGFTKERIHVYQNYKEALENAVANHKQKALVCRRQITSLKSS